MASVADEFLYDVFLSFRGEDTRHGFIGNLWKALDDKGVRTFIDNVKLLKGDEITPSLLKAIDESMMAIVVLSENYASSSFCLQELSKILDAIKDKGRCVLPVFYKVDPSDIRKLKKSYGAAMAQHEKRSSNNMNLLQKWKNALNQVANLSGFDYKGYIPIFCFHFICSLHLSHIRCPFKFYTHFFFGGRGLNPAPCIYYALSLLTELSSRELTHGY
jgi:hypothetical protein